MRAPLNPHKTCSDNFRHSPKIAVAFIISSPPVSFLQVGHKASTSRGVKDVSDRTPNSDVRDEDPIEQAHLAEGTGKRKGARSTPLTSPTPVATPSTCDEVGII